MHDAPDHTDANTLSDPRCPRRRRTSRAQLRTHDTARTTGTEEQQQQQQNTDPLTHTPTLEANFTRTASHARHGRGLRRFAIGTSSACHTRTGSCQSSFQRKRSISCTGGTARVSMSTWPFLPRAPSSHKPRKTKRKITEKNKNKIQKQKSNNMIFPQTKPPGGTSSLHPRRLNFFLIRKCYKQSLQQLRSKNQEKRKNTTLNLGP